MDGPHPLRRPRALLDALVALAARALAVATAAGLLLDAVRPGSALHPHFVGSTGVAALDTALALALAVAILAPPSLRRHAPRAARGVSVAVGATVALLAATALGRQVAAWSDGRLRADGVVPPATLVALAIVGPWTVAVARTGAGPAAPRGPLLRAVGTAAATVALLLAHVEAVGATDYRAEADAIVVLGAKVRADGRPSGALEDRTRTACALWKAGLAPVLVLSGGHGEGAPVSEPEAMRAIARAEGVPDAALVLDEGGADTAATVRFAARAARERGWRRVLVVSHDYHLARVRLLADRAGLVVRTVPAAETRPGGWKVAATARELLAWAATWAAR